jgi:hypothetical protein
VPAVAYAVAGVAVSRSRIRTFGRLAVDQSVQLQPATASADLTQFSEKVCRPDGFG